MEHPHVLHVHTGMLASDTAIAMLSRFVVLDGCSVAGVLGGDLIVGRSSHVSLRLIGQEEEC